MASPGEVGGILGGIAAVAAAAVGLRRKGRGRVRDTEAETLWQQLAGELVAVRAELAVHRIQIDAYRAENEHLRSALDEANRKAQQAHDEAEQLRMRVQHLEAKLAAVERAGTGGTL